MLKKYYFIFFSIIFFQITVAHQKAVVIIPVADCVGEPLSNYYPNKDIPSAYNEIPISWAGQKNSMFNCPRIHQLLFNEVVTVVEEKDEEAYVEIPNLFVESLNSSTRINRFWILKSNLFYLPQKDCSSFIPRPISYEKPYQDHENCITLRFPYYNEESGMLFSAGTRFAISKFNDDTYTIVFYDYTHKKTVYAVIPISLCYYPSSKTFNEKKKDFVRLLRLWAFNNGDSIPLVWGGTSFTSKNTLCCQKVTKCINNQSIEYWQPDKNISQPFTGFDSSGLILRATQICGLPYYYKNSTTAAKNLNPLSINDSLEEGDLLFVPGGLMVISNLKENRIIAAVGYQFGYGKVVELPLNKLFKNVSTYQDLLDCYFQHKPITTQKADGTISREIKHYTLLSLSNIRKKT